MEDELQRLRNPEATPDAPPNPNSADTAYTKQMAKVQFESALKSVCSEGRERPFGGLPFIGTFGDAHQLPPVAAKSHFDTSAPSSSDNIACNIGRLKFQEYLSPTHPKCKGVTVVMDSVYRQDDDVFKTNLAKLRDGTMDQDGLEFFMDRTWSKLSPAEQAEFEREALYVMPTWKRTQPITFKYLCELQQPIAKVKAQYSYNRRGKNHTKKEINLPARNALCVGAKVMLLHNFVVEQGLMNGSLGYLKSIVYSDSVGPLGEGLPLPKYCVVDFPDSKIPKEKAWDRENPTWIPIPCVTLQCEKRCCSMTTIPLRVCKAITYYKCQGMTIGWNCLWRLLVVALPRPGERSAPGGELVAFSRATSKEAFAILEDEEITFESFLSIGKGKSYDRKRAFEERLRARQSQSQQWILEKIIALDPSTTTEKSFDGGYAALVAWYNQHIQQPQ